MEMIIWLTVHPFERSILALEKGKEEALVLADSFFEKGWPDISDWSSDQWEEFSQNFDQK